MGGTFARVLYVYPSEIYAKYSEGGIWFPIEDTSSEVAEMGWLSFAELPKCPPRDEFSEDH